MPRDKRHTRTLPNGDFVVSTLACDDSDTSAEISLCSKTGFELGRAWLSDPESEAGKAFELATWPNWRAEVHYTDWISWGEPLPIGPCVCVDVSTLTDGDV